MEGTTSYGGMCSVFKGKKKKNSCTHLGRQSKRHHKSLGGLEQDQQRTRRFPQNIVNHETGRLSLTKQKGSFIYNQSGVYFKAKNFKAGYS